MAASEPTTIDELMERALDHRQQQREAAALQVSAWEAKKNAMFKDDMDRVFGADFFAHFSEHHFQGCAVFFSYRNRSFSVYDNGDTLTLVRVEPREDKDPRPFPIEYVQVSWKRPSSENRAALLCALHDLYEMPELPKAEPPKSEPALTHEEELTRVLRRLVRRIVRSELYTPDSPESDD